MILVQATCSLTPWGFVLQDQVERVFQKQLSMEDMFEKRRVSLKKLAAKQTRPVQPVAPRPEAIIKSPMSSPGASPSPAPVYTSLTESLFDSFAGNHATFWEWILWSFAFELPATFQNILFTAISHTSLHFTVIRIVKQKVTFYHQTAQVAISIQLVYHQILMLANLCDIKLEWNC